MARSGKKVMAASALAAVWCFRNQAFVPGPLRQSAAPAAAASAATMLAPAAFADEIGDAARKLGDASYDFAKEVDWNNGIYLQAPGKFAPMDALKALDKMFVMGAAANPQLLKAAAEAHHKAIGSIKGENGVTSRADWDAVNAALGRVVASVPESMVMDVYNSVSGITDKGVPAYMKSLVNGADAEKAYAGFLAFKDVVKKKQVAEAAAPALEKPKADLVGKAADYLSKGSYPFLKDIDWLSDIYIKPLPGATPQQALKAIDKAIVLSVAANGKYLAQATEAHHKAIGSIDAKGVTSLEDYTAVNAAIGRVIMSVPTSKVMDVYNAFAGIVGPEVPNKMFSMVDPLHANAAAKAFYDFKDVVKVAQDGYLVTADNFLPGSTLPR